MIWIGLEASEVSMVKTQTEPSEAPRAIVLGYSADGQGASQLISSVSCDSPMNLNCAAPELGTVTLYTRNLPSSPALARKLPRGRVKVSPLMLSGCPSISKMGLSSVFCLEALGSEL